MKMRKKLLTLALALLLCGGALAESCTGTITAADSAVVTVPADATLEAVSVRPGDLVRAGDTLGTLATSKVFAPEDGTVVRALARPGDAVDGAALELVPVSRYTVYCSVDSAYQSSASTLVRAGELLYIKCVADGTHRATGVVTQVEGGEYRVMTTGGALQVGEAVYLYRDSGFSSWLRVGIGTALAADTLTVEAQGTLIDLCVEEGEYVQRGELLCEVAPCAEVGLTAPQDGVVTQCPEAGAALKAGETAFAVVARDQLRVTARVSEEVAAAARVGQRVRLIFAGDPEEDPAEGTLAAVSGTPDGDGAYQITITSAALPLRLGLTVDIEL